MNTSALESLASASRERLIESLAVTLRGEKVPSRPIVSSFDHELLAAFHEACPTVALGWLIERASDEWREGATALGASAIHPGVKGLTASDVRAMRAARPWEGPCSSSVEDIALLIHPGGERELLVVGVPGDRDVDMKRLEASVAPAEVEMASDSDFEPHPELVRGCAVIASGPSATAEQIAAAQRARVFGEKSLER